MTTDCDRDDLEREIPTLGESSAQTPDPDDGFLVRSPTKRYALTARGDHDVHTAILQGLAAYVAGLEHAIAGRHIALSRVVTDWADHDGGHVSSPSAVVSSTEIGKYLTDSGMGPGAPTKIDGDGHGRILALSCSGMYRLEELRVEVMCEDKIQRAGVRQMLELAFSPVEWMAGFRLVLPRYYGAIAEFLLVTAQQQDAADTAAAGIRPLTMSLNARCPVYVPHHLPLARPTVTGTIGVGKRRI